MKTGLTERTIRNLQLNAGVLLSSYTKGEDITEESILGATRGGGSVVIQPTIRQMAVDGAPTYTKGLERIDDVTARLQFTMVEFSPTLVKRAIAGASINTGNADSVITSIHKVLTNDYQDVWWVGDTSDDKQVVVHLKNALNTDGLSLGATNKGEGTYSLNLVAHYEIGQLDTPPYEIIFENVVE